MIKPRNIADKGYYNTSQIANCEAKGTDVYVKPSKSKNATNNSDYSIDKFTFDKELNIYICPAGKHLTFKRNLSRRLNKTDAEATVVGYEYFCSDCAGCPHLHQCTNSVDGRRITRNANQDILDIIEKRFEENPKMYTIRKCVVEHPFGTIKRSLGYTYFLRRGLSAVKTEAALISLAYDLKRLVNISNLKEITKKLREKKEHKFIFILENIYVLKIYLSILWQPYCLFFYFIGQSVSLSLSLTTMRVSLISFSLILVYSPLPYIFLP